MPVPQFRRQKVTCNFEGEKLEYETWCRPLWDWIMDHLTDPELVPHFEWDAQKVFRYHNGNRVRVFTEPWTGNRFWEIQVSAVIFTSFHFDYANQRLKVVITPRSKNHLS
jgi:Plavaka transposase